MCSSDAFLPPNEFFAKTGPSFSYEAEKKKKKKRHRIECACVVPTSLRRKKGEDMLHAHPMLSLRCREGGEKEAKT
jgi:hypothetical protein